MMNRRFPRTAYTTAWLVAASIGLNACGGGGGGSGSSGPTPSEGLVDPAANEAILYYKRPDAAYSGWGLHLWNSESCQGVATETAWDAPLSFEAVSDQYGAYYRIPLSENAECVNFIVHKGDQKDLGGGDMSWRIDELGNRVFTLSGVATVSATPLTSAPIAIEGAKAHWLSADRLVWNEGASAASAELRYSSTADIQVNGGNQTVSGGTALPLQPSSLSDDLKARFPHLADRAALAVSADAATLATALKGQLVAIAYDAAGKVTAATKVQIPGVLDDLYAYEGELGARVGNDGVRFDLWAPTAQSVKLHVFDSNKNLLSGFPVDLTETAGVWSYQGDTSLNRQFYQYEVRVYHPATGRIETTFVTDPYALSLSRNSQYAQVVDLSDADLKPAGWDSLTPPGVARAEDIVIYEAHIRDFSAADASVADANRGKYRAFTETNSHGVNHLRDLQGAGLTHLHLLPTFDIATVDEDPDAQVNLDDPVSKLCNLSSSAQENWAQYCGSQTIRSVLESLDPNTGEVQALYADLRSLDAFNWGYDPFHFTVPEGSYASDAEGVQRIIEFREMVKAVSELGLNLVMDVVYNHTNAAGLSEKSVLDKIVPGYYHRLNADSGDIERSTCCENTASEHAMMEKLMVDSLVTWSQHYKISGYRFDLMGHHMRENILNALAAVRAVDPDTYFYGEGWNFGEVIDNTRGVNGIQRNMAGTGVGTFNDRMRDAVRGGGPFDGGDALRGNQGFANGLYVIPNEMNSDSPEELQNLLHRMDWIRVGVSGGLRNYAFETAEGTVLAGQQVAYNDQQAGYTLAPRETINYVSKHDNQTLWDINQYKVASSVSTEDRVRMQLLALSVPMLSQGIPFFHMGSEILRSKSMERDSYDSGDWFNAVDFSYQTTQWNKGLPREDKDGDNWDLIRQIIADSNAQPTNAHILAAKAGFLELLSVRTSSPLFRLATSAEVIQRLRFHNTGPNQIPGLLAYSLDDGTQAGADLDPDHDAVMVVINASGQSQTLSTDLTGFVLHPVLQGSADSRRQSASVAGGDFTLPALTVAVFVQPQAGAQGAGAPVAMLSGGALVDPGAQELILYYKRDDDNYDGWGLHLWNNAECSGVASPTDWNSPLTHEGVDPVYGAYYRIPLQADAQCINFIVHRGDDKDLGGADMRFHLDDLGYRVFTRTGVAAVTPFPR